MKNYLLTIGFNLLVISCYAQTGSVTAGSISFICFSKETGFIIDSVEKKSIGTFNYISDKDFCFAALIQLPDSMVIIRIKTLSRSTMTDMPISENDLNSLSAKISQMDNELSNQKGEDEMIKLAAGEYTAYRLISKNELKFPSINTGTNTTEKILIQHSPDRLMGFFHAGLGGLSYYKKGLFSFELEIGVVKNHSLISARYISGQGNKTEDPRMKVRDFALMYGLIIKNDRQGISASAGISYFKGIYHGNLVSSYGGGWGIGTSPSSSSTNIYEKKTYSGFGIPVEVNIFLGTKKTCGFSLTGFANINANRTYGGLLACIRFGSIE